MSVSLLFSFCIFPFVAYLTGQVYEPLVPGPEYVSAAFRGSTQPSWNCLPVQTWSLVTFRPSSQQYACFFLVFFNPSLSCLLTVRVPLASTHLSKRCQTSGWWWRCKCTWILSPGCEYTACLNWFLVNVVVTQGMKLFLSPLCFVPTLVRIYKK